MLARKTPRSSRTRALRGASSFRLPAGHPSRAIGDRLAGDLMGSFAILDWLGVAIELPLVLSQDSDSVAGVTMSGMDSFSVGDGRVTPKVELLRQERHGLGVAVRAAFTLPTSSSSDFVGEDGATFEPELAVSRSEGALRWAANLGYRVRRQRELANLEIDDELMARAGLGFRVAAASAHPVEADLSLSVASAAEALFDRYNQNHVEALLGAQVGVAAGWLGFAGAGVGLNQLFGTPDWRIVLGTRFHVERSPSALAPLVESRPAPPADDDPDRDGLVSEFDRCPAEAEVVNGWEDKDGCPDQVPDGDGDGLDDLRDACATEPEDVDAFTDEDGCPDPDNDADTVLDAEDRCPVKAGAVENLGCPDTDRDADTIVDRLDNCPDEPGSPDHLGCKRRQLVQLSAGKLAVLDKIYFQTSKAEILKRSFSLLDNVAAVLVSHPEIDRIRIEGHTDDRGADERNLGLSQRRAQAVLEYLISQGVAAERLEAVGFGETRPLQPNTTREGQAVNRRVEFVIVGDGAGIEQRDGGPGDDTRDR